jgi:DNA-binding transcriptional regulator LsrR (DeoR family)
MSGIEKSNYRLDDKKRVIEYFKNNENNSLKEIMKATGFSKNFVNTVLDRYLKEKTVKIKIHENNKR